MSEYCQTCEDSISTEAKLAKYETQLIAMAKEKATQKAKSEGYTGLLYVVRFTNNFGVRKYEDLDGREYVDSFLV